MSSPTTATTTTSENGTKNENDNDTTPSPIDTNAKTLPATTTTTDATTPTSSGGHAPKISPSVEKEGETKEKQPSFPNLKQNPSNESSSNNKKDPLNNSSHRRIYSAVEGSLAQAVLLNGIEPNTDSNSNIENKSVDTNIAAAAYRSPSSHSGNSITDSEAGGGGASSVDAATWNALATHRVASTPPNGEREEQQTTARMAIEAGEVTPVSKSSSIIGWDGFVPPPLDIDAPQTNDEDDGLVVSSELQPRTNSINSTSSGYPPQPPMSTSTPPISTAERRRIAQSLTSSTRSIMSSYSTDLDDVTEEDLEGLVVRTTTTNPNENQKNGENTEANPDNDNTSLDVSAMGGYISSASASASAASNVITSSSGVVVNAVGAGGLKPSVHHRHGKQPHSKLRGSGNPNIRSPAQGGGGDVVDGGAILRAIEGLKHGMEKSMGEMRESTKRDLDRVLTVVQQEATKRTALEGRLHSQLLLQSETMVAMELKLLRLEARVQSREVSQRQRPRQIISGGSIGASVPGGGSSLGAASGPGHLPPISTLSPGPNTIDEEDDLGSLDVISHPPRSRASGASTLHSGRIGGPPAAVVSSGASLASAVTATSFLDGMESLTQINDDESTKQTNDDGGSSDDGDVEDEGDGAEDNNDGSASTPTQSSRNQFATLDSILLNPIINSAASEHGTSTRATRGDADGNSSLATSVTSATQPSTVVTATTRGDSVANNPRPIIRLTDSGQDNPEESSTPVVMVSGSAGRSRRENFDAMFGLSSPPEDRPRSRSQSPLTVQSAATASVGPQSIASASVTGSILSTAAVAPSRSFGTRRAAAAAAAAAAATGDNRTMANRVVSFTSSEILVGEIPAISEGGDSITMPDELDNLSDVADAFASSSRLWREEYEARLDAIQKRWGGD